MRATICVLVFGALLAGCGGGGSKTPSGGSAGPQNLVSAAYKYAACMRQHGVPNFPDPQITSEDGQQRIRLMARTGAASSPAFNAAQSACSGILPSPQNANPARTALQRHERELGLLSFARCMRTHGVNNFPDPNAQAQITREMLAGAGIDVHLSDVIRTAMTCVPASHGAVSRAAVAQAVHGGG